MGISEPPRTWAVRKGEKVKHEIYPMRASEDGELLPPVVVEVPDILYLQVVDEGDCEDWPAPSEPDERTFSWERINASDVAYAPLARAEAEAAALRAELDAARAGQVQARCCYCNKPATMARTYYDRGFPSAREHLCAEHFEHHPWHGDEEARP